MSISRRWHEGQGTEVANARSCEGEVCNQGSINGGSVILANGILHTQSGFFEEVFAKKFNLCGRRRRGGGPPGGGAWDGR